MRVWNKLWRDEGGSVLSAEAVLLGAVMAAGATTGLKMAGDSLHNEFRETAFALRSLDQSYSYCGHRGCGAWTAGSCFIQRPVEESLAELRAIEEEESRVEQKKQKQFEEKKPEEPEVKPKKKQLKKPAPSKPDDSGSGEESRGPVRFELIDPNRPTDA